MFPLLDESTRLNRLAPPAGKIRMVLDTDTYNEVDDQFALAYALSCPERITVEAIYAAPFHNERSSGPEDGMLRSHEEIHRVLERMHREAPEGFVHMGSTRYLGSPQTPCRSAATDDLIRRAFASEEPLYVVAIGAITNIASAILLEPALVERIVVVWLGGNALHWPHTWEFNLQQDVPAARVVLDSGVPFVMLPCNNVVTHLSTTVAELERHLDGRSEIGSYLTGIVRDCGSENPAWSRVIWDVSAIAWLVNPEWVPTTLVHSPVLTDQMTWSVDRRRHWIRIAESVDRDRIGADLFPRVARA